MAFRMERDALGTVEVPEEAYYGAQTQRAVLNFPVSGRTFPRPFIRALGLIKQFAAEVNLDLGLLPPGLSGAIRDAAREVADGKLDSQFVLDVFQTGSGTSTNMNANEVIAGRANEILTGRRGGKEPVHPNDHVNLGQSSNDVIPTVIHVAAVAIVREKLVPSLKSLTGLLTGKADEFRDVMKIGRTHLQDAVPITLGQEFGGYARQAELGVERALRAADGLSELALGGTAVGNGLNSHPEFARRVIGKLSEAVEFRFREAKDHFEAQAAQDGVVEASGQMKTLAVSLMKIAGDVRLLASGPRCGLGEITIPSLQPGSSIMPGKVNPVMPEMLIQVGAQVIGNDAAITICGQGGYFELNTMLPVIARNLLESIEILAAAVRLFGDNCVSGIEANRERCGSFVERSLALSTYLVPHIGYDRASEISKEAYSTGKTIREVALQKGILSAEKLDDIFRDIKTQ
ncbi:MAG: class II fumarate hydratase [Desulfobacteraceae bacterium]|nr:class II fumarate hydratase [Desulfobacteraceae bacterium]